MKIDPWTACMDARRQQLQLIDETLTDDLLPATLAHFRVRTALALQLWLRGSSSGSAAPAQAEAIWQQAAAWLHR